MLVPPALQTAAVRTAYALPRPVRRVLAGRAVSVDGQTLDPDMALLLRLVKLSGRTLGAMGVEAARANQVAGSAAAAGPRVQGVATSPVAIDAPDHPLAARLYGPDGLEPGSALLVYFHGGGWVLGNLDTHDNLCRSLALGAGARVLSVDYRLGPEHPFPAAVDDAVAALRFALREASSLGVRPDAVAVGGDSAGGNLAVNAALGVRGDDGPKPAFLLVFYPGVDGRRKTRSRRLFDAGYYLTGDDMRWFERHYLADPDHREDPRYSLLAGDLSGLPPTYITTAGFDPLRDEGEQLGVRLEELGIPTIVRRHPDLLHGFANMPAIGPRPREAIAEAAGALRAALALATGERSGGR